MKRKFPLILMACLSLLLTSCLQDTMTSGTLDYSFNPTTSSAGYFEASAVLYPNNIKTTDYASTINSFSLAGSTLKISGEFYNGDVVRNLQIDVDGVGVYQFNPIYLNGSSQTITVADSYYDSDFYNFMYKVFDYMSRYGKQDIIVSGYLTNGGSPIYSWPITISFYNDLDVNVTK